MSDEAQVNKLLTLIAARDIANRLKAVDDALRLGSGYLMVSADGSERVPTEVVMTWGKQTSKS